MSTPQSVDPESGHGVPLFLNQLVEALRLGRMTHPEIGKSAGLHGNDLRRRGYTTKQVVHDYGNICQSITDLALEVVAPISTDDFRTLNRCLDDAIAAAALEQGPDQARTRIEAAAGATEPVGLIDDEMRILINTAIEAFEALTVGNIGIGGSTGRVLGRTLISLRALAARPPGSV